jgi:hypothetical protein
MRKMLQSVVETIGAGATIAPQTSGNVQERQRSGAGLP